MHPKIQQITTAILTGVQNFETILESKTTLLDSDKQEMRKAFFNSQLTLITAIEDALDTLIKQQ